MDRIPLALIYEGDQATDEETPSVEAILTWRDLYKKRMQGDPEARRKLDEERARLIKEQPHLGRNMLEAVKYCREHQLYTKELIQTALDEAIPIQVRFDTSEAA